MKGEGILYLLDVRFVLSPVDQLKFNPGSEDHFGLCLRKGRHSNDHIFTPGFPAYFGTDSDDSLGAVDVNTT